MSVTCIVRRSLPPSGGSFEEKYFNDRVVLYVNDVAVQYDGPAVPSGSHYKKVTREQFEKWAGEDVTDFLPEGMWQVYK